jgi:hypothetical protein
MNIKAPFYCLLFSALFLLYSCQDDESFDDDFGVAFGIRQDKNLADYEAVAAANNPALPSWSGEFGGSHGGR